ncbi:hypothetical protein PIB30_044136 [Stylosanthes scabra]|uniref:Uncharacterized protein n=1 Tax=Stylosanthes scabra TaxID=79078 RepID=A0ABU6UEJ0_9FABA|nr:hypothetical protein [Stylosanthes scabra]
MAEGSSNPQDLNSNHELGQLEKQMESLVTADEGLNFIEKDVRNYITREVRNVSEEEDAKELGKYFLRMKEKNPNFFYELYT